MQDEKEKNRNTEQAYFANLAYNPSEQHQINLRYTREPSRQKARMAGELSVWEGTEMLYEKSNNAVQSESTEDNINLYYKGTLGRHWVVDLSADWFEQRGSSEQQLQEKHRLTEISSGTKSSLWGLSPRAIYRAAQSRLEMGVDLNQSTIRSRTALSIEDAHPTNNTILERKGAGYVGYHWTSRNQEWQLGGGLRFERTDKGYLDNRQDGAEQHYDYNTLLPSLSLSFSRGNWGYHLDYNSSIQYPAFNQLASGETYFNRYNIKRSNPALERALLHRVSYDCSFHWLYVSAAYTYTQHPIMETFARITYKG